MVLCDPPSHLGAYTLARASSCVWNLAFRRQREYPSDVNLLRTIPILACVEALAVRADVQVLFQNNVFTPPRLVTFSSGSFAGTGVRNGVDGNANFVAQLFRVTGSGDEAIGAPANFRAATTTQPGTWSGGPLNIVGVNPGEIVNLVVKVWDSRVSSVWQAVDLGMLYGRSAIFSYTQPVAPQLPSDLYITGFAGFSIGNPLTPPWAFAEVFAPPFSLLENEAAGVPNAVFPGGTQLLEEEWLWWRRQLGELFPMAAGSLGGSLREEGRRLVYVPESNRYGDFARLGIMNVQVLPSPKRPYLELVPRLETSARRLVLRGLAPKRYRVEQSENLTDWEPVGEFTANYSEVPVEDLSPLSATARFYRAVELAP